MNVHFFLLAVAAVLFLVAAAVPSHPTAPRLVYLGFALCALAALR